MSKPRQSSLIKYRGNSLEVREFQFQFLLKSPNYSITQENFDKYKFLLRKNESPDADLPGFGGRRGLLRERTAVSAAALLAARPTAPHDAVRFRAIRELDLKQDDPNHRVYNLKTIKDQNGGDLLSLSQRTIIKFAYIA